MEFIGKKDPYLEELVRQFHQEFSEVYPYSETMEILMARGLEVDFSMRLETCAGKAYYRKNRISIHYRLLKEKPQELRETYGHELAHLLVDIRIGKDARNHGRHWQNTMRDLGLKPEIYHKMCVASFRRPKVRHLFGCSICVREFYLTKYKANNSHRYKCRCGGSLIPKQGGSAIVKIS